MPQSEASPYDRYEEGIPFSRQIMRRLAYYLTVYTMHQDPGKRKRDVRSLRARSAWTEPEWKNVFDAVPDMVCILDRDRRIIGANRAFCSRLSYDPLMGRHCYEVLHRSFLPPATCPFIPVIEARQQAPQERELVIGNSLFLSSLFAFYDAKGMTRGAVHVFRDITDLKKAERATAQPGKPEAAGAIASELSHEINNHLDYLSNYLYLLSDSLPPGFAKREYLDKMQKGIDNLVSLTRGLLQCATPPLATFVPLDMLSVIEDSLAGSSERAERQGVLIEKKYHSGDSTVKGSDRMLKEALSNVILNSLDAMPSGGRLVVTTRAEADRFVLEVADSGTGIAAELQSRIFEPFFTTKKSSEKRRTGLGLTICYNIIRAHQGEINVENTFQKGAKFVISLPRYNDNIVQNQTVS